MENEKLFQTVKELELQQHQYYDVMIKYKTDILHQQQVASRLQAIISNIIAHVPNEQQPHIVSLVEKAKCLDVQDQQKLVQTAASQLQVDLAQLNLPNPTQGNKLTDQINLLGQQQQQNNTPNLLNMLAAQQGMGNMLGNNNLPNLLQMMSNNGMNNPLQALMANQNNPLAAAAAALQAQGKFLFILIKKKCV